MRGLRPSLCAAGSLLAAAGALWLLASALLGFHAWPGGPADEPPGVARLPAAVKPAAATPSPGPVSRAVTLVHDTAAPVATVAPAPVQTVVAGAEDAAQQAAPTADGLLGGG